MSGFDYIIIGGGSAGCVAASALVRNRGARVLLLERGPERVTGWAALLKRMPGGWMKGITGSPTVEMHEPVPQRHLDGRAPAVGQANMLGGGTAVNARSIRAASRRITTIGTLFSAVTAAGPSRTCCRISGTWRATAPA